MQHVRNLMTSDTTTAVDERYFWPSLADVFLEYRNASTSVDVWITKVNKHRYFSGMEIARETEWKQKKWK